MNERFHAGRRRPDHRTSASEACPMTDAQYDRLPGVLRRIVDADRSDAPWLAATRQPVVPISVAKVARRRLQDRRALTAEAERLYGHRLAGVDPVMT